MSPQLSCGCNCQIWTRDLVEKCYFDNSEPCENNETKEWFSNPHPMHYLLHPFELIYKYRVTVLWASSTVYSGRHAHGFVTDAFVVIVFCCGWYYCDWCRCGWFSYVFLCLISLWLFLFSWVRAGFMWCAITRHIFQCCLTILHDDVIKWKHFPRYWPFVMGFTVHRWIPLTKASDTELWCFLWSESEQTVEQTIERLVIWDAIASIMASL